MSIDCRWTYRNYTLEFRGRARFSYNRMKNKENFFIRMVRRTLATNVLYRFDTSHAVEIMPLTHKSTGTIFALALGLHLSVRMTPVPVENVTKISISNSCNLIVSW